MAKTKTQIEDLAKIVGKTTGSFQDPPLVDAPFTQIKNLDGSPRQLPDPSKTLKPAMGIERVLLTSLSIVNNEKGPNEEQVFKTNDDRIRFVGPQWTRTYDTNGSPIKLPNSGLTGEEFVEITFYGTGLNLGQLYSSNNRDIRVTIDGGSESANISPSGISDILHSRQYNPNQVLKIASGLTLGLHTIKIRSASVSFGLIVYHFEVLNEEADIQVPEGEVLAKGRKYVQSAATTTPHDSDFDGSPTLNGRGGRVLAYKLPDDETVYKAIQQTDGSQKNLTLADHSNEEMIRKINFREFGANRADDFSTLTTVSDRAFTLDDGTTTLVGNDVDDASAGILRVAVVGAFATLTFVGTGLDVVSVLDSSSAQTEVVVDGNSIINNTGVITQIGINKIVSGLPYGTHTVKIEFAGGSGSLRFSDFIIYGPKKPSIPDDAKVVKEYYLMADFAANTTPSTEHMSTGVLRKQNIREFVYTNEGGGWNAVGLDVVSYNSGFAVLGSGSDNKLTYTFFGTGFDFRFRSTTSRATAAIVNLNGVLATLGGGNNFPTASSSVYGGAGISFTESTGIFDQSLSAGTADGAGFVISGLPLDLYTVEIDTNATGNLDVASLDIITPIHYPNTKVGSLSMGGDVKVLEQSEEAGVDLSKAKAWLRFDGFTNEILSSHNISAVVDVATGRYIVYFEKIFKNKEFVVTGTAFSGSTGTNHFVFGMSPQSTLDVNNAVAVQVRNIAGTAVDAVFGMAVFGELADEGDE